ncbi:YhcN/YlaJ family sporulation lipoprotein [Pseudogracilibacillus sp. SE30717A]|uniref:YhcN/YlaJ family sporulation lipoprotein n=1 Tax=Pseudogracilibacillus sp. SE30717A TaxID=3098293 RepID=UPI00300DFE66
MYLKRIIIIISIFILTACANNIQKDPTFEPTGNRDLELVKLSSKEIMDQNPSNRAKELLSQYAEISGVRAVNDKNELLIGVDIDHHERFSLDNMESELRKKIKENFSDLKVTLSTDQKILLELEKLEEDIRNKKVSNDELRKKIKELKSLSKEET